METDPFEAQSALDVVAAAEKRSAQIATSTPWYGPWYGVTCALIPAAIAFLAARSVVVGLALIMLETLSLAALVMTYQQVTGVWPSARGMTRHFVAAITVMFGAGILNYLVSSTLGAGWWVAAVFVVTTVLMGVLSRSYDAALVRSRAR